MRMPCRIVNIHGKAVEAPQYSTVNVHGRRLVDIGIVSP
jgi:hypothetical protein